MKRLAIALGILALLAVQPARANDPPPNDDYANATVIPETIWTTTVDVSGATLEAGEPEGCGGLTKSIWFRFTAPAEIDVLASTQGSEYPTEISVYKEDTLLTCESHPEALADVQLTTEPGVAYYFQMGPTSATDGPLVFNFRYMYRVSGTVRDAAGDPIPGICVDAYDMNGDHTYHTNTPYTAADGTYTIKFLYPGPHKFAFGSCWPSNARYQPQWYNGKATIAEADPVESGPDGGPTRVTDIDATMQKNAAIVGEVTDDRGTIAPWYICIDVWRDGKYVTSAYTDSTGKYAVALAPGGGYKLQFATCDYDRYVAEWYNNAYTQEAATELTVPAGDWATADIELDPGSTITGTVTDKDGNPIAYECVDVIDTDGNIVESYTNDEGVYDARMLPAGTYRVRYAGCSYARYLTQWYHGSFTEEGATTIDIAGTGDHVSGIDDVLDVGGIIRGKVTDASGIAVRNECVAVYDTAGKPVKSTWTLVNGTYSFAALKPGLYKVRLGGCSATYVARWWDGKTSIADADPVPAVLDRPTEHIDAVLPLREAPSNDARASAMPVTGDLFRDTRNTLQATRETGEPSCANVQPKNTVWYTYTPAKAGMLTLWTIGSDYDTMIGVSLHSGTPGDGVNISCTDARTTVGEQATLPVVAGQQIDIQIGGYAGGGTLKFLAEFTSLED